MVARSFAELQGRSQPDDGCELPQGGKLLSGKRIEWFSHAPFCIHYPRRVYPFRFRGLRGQVFLMHVAIYPKGGLQILSQKMFLAFAMSGYNSVM
jgi:hypothetical protein